MDVKQTIDNVDVISGGVPTKGLLKLTDYHIVFSALPPPGSKSPDRPRENFISFQLIGQCFFRPTLPSSPIPSSIRLRCRDFSYVTFNFPDDRSARESFEFIRTRTCRLGTIERLYAFQYKSPKPEQAIDGWALYDPREEFRRQGISSKSRDLGWRVSEINQDYSFSPTYPALLVVPSSISDNVLKHARTHRSRARIPALSYLHPVNNCVITRSSQPCVGLRGNRSIQDERLVGACFAATVPDSGGSSVSELAPSASQPSLTTSESSEEQVDGSAVLVTGIPVEFDAKTGKRVLYGATRQNLIVDARPAINSYAMQAIGKGSENMEYYPFAKKVFLSIDNIHVMRDSLGKVIEAVKDADVSPFPPNRELLAKSGWLKHIKSILEGSALIAKQVGIFHANILIHCSDGWDRTSQLSALSQIMLDPYYRTIDGFIVLVEKDWLSFGHMFQQRSGFLNHEKWFVVQTDGLAGTRIEPGDSDAYNSLNNNNSNRNEAFENAISSAKRFFTRSLQQDKSDSDGEAGEDPARPASTLGPQNEATRPNEISPVFHQFLDATYQLLRQNPTRFQFNERFLRRLLYHLYSCQYGTFLYNSDQQRHEAQVQKRTQSVWNYFLSRRQEFTNPDFDPVVDDNIRGKERLLFPKEGYVRWWHQLYSRRDEEMNAHLDEAALASERVAAYQSATAPASGASSPRPGSSTPSAPQQPPGLVTSKSVVVGTESAHSALTPEIRRHPELRRSSSAGDAGSKAGNSDEAVPNEVEALQDRISGLMQKQVAEEGGLGLSTAGGSSSNSGEPTAVDEGGRGSSEPKCSANNYSLVQPGPAEPPRIDKS